LLVAEAIEIATDKFSAAGVQSPSIDAEILCAFVLGVSRKDLVQLIVLEQSFPENKIQQFHSAVSRREKREPLQHITGLAPFRHIELEVGPGVFIPRPETEQLVSLALEKLKGISDPVIVDMCSGSGAVAVSLATELAGARVYAVEISGEAFAYLQRNFQNYGLDVSVLRNEDLATCFDELEGKVDMVISNPPYIPNRAVPVDLEVQLHDPALALYGGEDGLDVVRSISSRALYLLKPSGQLLVEHADTQAAAVGQLLLARGWQETSSFQDLAGKDRIFYARKP
jgi:release factor glutamine methyltransferase